ncbi:adenosine deaminase AGSA-like [Physella acuta]|uniref:adenosine deaminase AGSA-like n=1 Tax=Physella acuta TaxID=109671 RepID=UPI0027DAEEF8|nr:adenosine deaminase AGSA-like [Physella acuta]XP_059162014.1 adenosine deaminase AGSA-like [Physella acuta]
MFELIHRMPKGAALHIHDQSMVSLDWIIKNATYRDNVYMCLNHHGNTVFRVFNSTYKTPGCEWKLVREERRLSGDVTAFDLSLKQNLSLVATDPLLTFADNQAAWVRFGRYFGQVHYLLYHVPIYRDMLWQTMEEFYEANVQYLEIRGTFDKLFELDGTEYDMEFGVLLVEQVAEDFKKKHPDFYGVKVIINSIRFRNVSVVLEEIKTTMQLHRKYPDLMAGFDMSGNEALYNPLSYYSEALLYPSRQDPPYKLPYFFHAGETSWQGTKTGHNLADAILLNASRVGHALTLSKHPRYLELIRQKDIAIEVEPISNQVLRLVSDLRNHPMAALIAHNVPVVISSDDRTTWDAAPMSHDFYVTFMAMSSDLADLTLLKQLAINSIRYSSLGPAQKETAMEVWQTKWEIFVGDVHAAEAKPDMHTNKASKFSSQLTHISFILAIVFNLFVRNVL